MQKYNYIDIRRREIKKGLNMFFNSPFFKKSQSLLAFLDSSLSSSKSCNGYTEW